MENREELEDITRLSENVVRILGQNPGKFTLQGTNTYLIGTQNPYILVDAAEGRDAYIPVLKLALDQARTDSTQPDISDIIISHWHLDHIGGLPCVLDLIQELYDGRNPGKPYTPPRLHKFPADENTDGQHITSWNKLPAMIAGLSKDIYTPALDGVVFHDLFDAQTFKDASGSAVIRVLHTPGHTVDSISLHIPPDRALYTADTVLGHGTAVFEDLATYLASLNRMLHYGSPAPPVGGEPKADIDLEYVTLYPAHGAVVANGRETIATYIKHRIDRENQVLGTLRSSIPAELLDNAGEATPFWTTWNIVRTMYKTYPESLWEPAARGIYLHLKKLEGDGLVQRVGGEGNDTQWKLLVSPSTTPSL